MAGPSFSVGSGNLNQLRTVLDSKQGEVLGKRDKETGTITLYVSSKAPSVIDRLSGRTLERRALATEGLKETFARYEALTSRRGDYTETGKTSSAALFTHIQDELSVTRQQGTSTEDARSLADAAQFITRALPQRSQGGTAPAPAANQPRLAHFGLLPHGRVVGSVAERLVAGGDRPALAMTFGDDLAARFRGRNTSFTARLGLALGDGAGVKGELKAALRQTLATTPGANLSNDEIDSFVDQAVDHALGKAMTDQAVSGTATAVQGPKGSVDLPDITVGGRTYAPKGFLGEGGFADVFLFETTTTPVRQIALKLTKDTAPEARAEVGKEIGLHQRAFGTGAGNIIGFEGALRLPDGRIGIALEIAPHGDAHEMMETVRGAVADGPNVPKGKITAEESKILFLTMIKDMGVGLKEMHANQSVHRDVKGKNFMIGTDGSTKLADFNTALPGTRGANADATPVDTPFYVAPEMLRANQVIRDVDNKADKDVTAQERAVQRQLRPLLPTASDEVLELLVASITEPHTSPIRAQANTDRRVPIVDTAVDVWGIGATALEMFTGDTPANSRWASTVEEKLTSFGRDRNNDPLGTRQNGDLSQGAVGERTGDRQVDSLLRGLLRPDPRDRLKGRQIEQHPVMRRGGVGSPEAKALLVALNSGDPDRIETARQALRGVMR